MENLVHLKMKDEENLIKTEVEEARVKGGPRRSRSEQYRTEFSRE